MTRKRCQFEAWFKGASNHLQTYLQTTLKTRCTRVNCLFTPVLSWFEVSLKVIKYNKIVYCRHDLKWFEAWFEGKFDQCDKSQKGKRFLKAENNKLHRLLSLFEEILF